MWKNGRSYLLIIYLRQLLIQHIYLWWGLFPLPLLVYFFPPNTRQMNGILYQCCICFFNSLWDPLILAAASRVRESDCDFSNWTNFFLRSSYGENISPTVKSTGGESCSTGVRVAGYSSEDSSLTRASFNIHCEDLKNHTLSTLPPLALDQLPDQ